jgi:hypothetical protein
MSAINGIGYPIFKIYLSGSFVEDIELPLTNKTGLIELYEEKSITHELNSHTTLKTIDGWKIYFKLYYNEFTSKTTTQKIIRLLNLEKNGYTIYLVPRNDNLGRVFEVVGLNNQINLGVLKDANRLIELNYVTKNLVTNLVAIDIEDNIVVFDYENLIII